MLRRAGQALAPRLPAGARSAANLAWESAECLGRFARPWLASAGGRPVVMAYDGKVSPATFGDFLYFCLVARLFAVAGRRVEMAYLDDEIRDDVQGLEDAYRFRVEQYDEIAAALAIPGRFRFQRMAFAELAGWREGLGRVGCYPSRAAQDERAQVYGQSWTTLEHGLRRAPRGVRERFVLDAGEVAENLGATLPPGPYAVVAGRAGSAWDPSRDVLRDELLRQIDMIRARFPNDPVWIASDAVGTEAIKGWKLDRPDLHYAQDFGPRYILNLRLALGARCFVQIRGGGLSSGLLFSRTPIFVAADPVTESSWWMRSPKDGVHALPWAHERTRWVSRGTDVESRLEQWLDELAEDAARPSPGEIAPARERVRS